jgi:glycosyltransferase involved in cell wall biosynthesis
MGGDGTVSVRVIRLDRWSGIPLARNTGAAYASAPLLLITDANVRAGLNWDIPIFREIRYDVALCATIADMNSAWRGGGCMLDLPSMGIRWLTVAAGPEQYVPVSPCTGTVIYRELFNKLGGFDTNMPVYGAAEPEFSVRAWLYGARIKNIPDLVFYHRFRPAEERRPFLNRINYLQVRNYLRFGWLYLGDGDIREMNSFWQMHEPDGFAQAVAALDYSEIGSRRRYLRSRLKYDFSWFKNTFINPMMVSA